jgi:triacylglycerol lipase
VAVARNLLLAFFAWVVLFNGALYLWRRHMLHAAPSPDHVPEPLGFASAAWAFLVECTALAAWLALIPAAWCLPRGRGGPGTRGAVVLVHGWALNTGSLWLLRRRLLRDGWGPVHCFSYRTLRGDLDTAAHRLHRWLRHVAPERPVTLVGHSLGGLLLRFAARRYPMPGVRRIVTLGTPHFGTAVAAGPGSPLPQLAPGSAWLTQLNAGDRVPQQFDVISIHSTFDAMVLPLVTAYYPQAFNVQVNDVGHNALLLSRKVYQLLAENLAAPLR